MKRLNFGSAFDIHEGWVNLDNDDHGQEVTADVLKGLPFEDDYFDCIVANHSLQCIRFEDLPRALAELLRVLKPGGTLRILVPDSSRTLHHWYLGIDHFPIADTVEDTVDGRALRYLFWHGDTRSAFTAESLASTLSKAGFTSTRPMQYGVTTSGIDDIVSLDSRKDESIVMEASK